MVFTLFHAFISFILFYFLRLEAISFFTGVIAPDIEAIYFATKAYEVCEPRDYACLAEYPSHWFLHSFLGITLLSLAIALLTGKVRSLFNLKKHKISFLFFSAWLGGASHLLVDLTVHKGDDSLMLFFPYPEKYSFIFPNSYLLWHVIALIGLILLIANIKKLRAWLK